MATPTAILDYVTTALDGLFAAAVPYAGMIPSILDRDTLRMPDALPDGIPGQRVHDRAFRGSNLMHDQATLATARALATALDRPDLADASDRYLRRFVAVCAGSPTGLFPWGEHSFWHLTEDRIGDSYTEVAERPGERDPIHDHLRQAPRWLLEAIAAIEPDCLSRFADGLKGHWNRDARGSYIRHAYIERTDFFGTNSKRSCDFPRHGGFYIYDWCLAWRLCGRSDLRSEIEPMLDYWWEKRDARDLCLIESRCPETERFFDTNAPGQTLSLAVSLLESAEILGDLAPALAATMRERAAAYTDGFFAAPHDPDAGVFVILSNRTTNAVTETMPVWGSRYGGWPASYVALTALCGYRLTADPRLLAWAEAVGRTVVATPMPSATAIPAMDAGLALGLLADLYDITGERPWLDAALDLADTAMAAFGGARIPRGAPTLDYYDSQTGPCFLLHGLARVALLARDGAGCVLGPDYTSR